jgi:hypothetical protein
MSPIVGEVVGAAIEVGAAVLLVTLVGRALFNRRRFRGMVGPGTAGAVYELLNEDKRRAVELIVEQRTADRDPETRDGTPDHFEPLGRPEARQVN